MNNYIVFSIYFSVIISIVNFIYSLNKKISNSCKAIPILNLSLVLFSILELLKLENNSSIFGIFQNGILAFLPVLFTTFILKFHSEIIPRKIILSYSIPIIYIILKFTKVFKNIPYNYYLFASLLIIYITFFPTKKSMDYIRIRYLNSNIITIFFASIFFYVFIFIFYKNHPVLSISLSFVMIVIQSIIINRKLTDHPIDNLIKSIEQANTIFVLLDEDDNVLYINEAGLKFIGLSRDEIIGKKNEEIIKITKTSNHLIEKNGKTYRFSLQETNAGKVLIINDITSGNKSFSSIDILSNLFDSLFDNVPDGVVIIKEDGTILKCNRQFLEMFGYSKDEVIGEIIDNLIVPEDLSNEPKLLRELVKNQKTLRVETIRKRKDGKKIEVRLTVAKIKNNNTNNNDKAEDLIYAFYTDITSEKEALNIVRNTLQKDMLTGLYTRSYFLRRLTSLSEFSLIGDHHGIILIDIDNFSQINILKNHAFGDEILRQVALRIKNSLREGDIISRPYADEFWIIIEKAGKNYQQAREVINNIVSKIFNEISKPYYIDGEVIELKFSSGLHVFSIIDNADEVMRKANLALKRAKSSKDKIIFYNILIDNELQEKSTKERDLREAFHNRELKIFLQPICKYDKTIVGAEALLRWVKKDGSVLPPIEFIQLLEENGMIVSVGEEILRQVCEVLSENNELKFIDINVSPVQLRDEKMAERFFNIVSSYEIDPSKIVIEITENILIDMNDIVKNNIDKLLKYGFELCIDDFGTGYSSLAYLTLLPLKKIKIDKSFVFRLPDDRKSIKLLEAIYNIAKAFQLEAIPEGVENEKQLEILSMIGYKLFQGFFFGKPVPTYEFLKRLTKE
ncbi:sensor domain-containing protein [Fervidobacterium nodosum]|uniref:Diguanylate cyclase/phosphodiesterase with PAS/PAC and GAF sensor(S) n=1 Tax=Fervidobacterium nodosum (strain ATCC 35602 / DSM 5306 / Rt17-B1) TaxID=381764 RepID=A7HKA4_FERNB|nr:EAL domain-containing protein [Fervidobacterium nodosum]ABS60337.1 diguanylate cyclase/phosphodiesterase with PAS/PAC and GAF sensor(s) [Fervidobacterium nodosum Rt17-B1]